MNFKELSLEEKIGQKFMFGVVSDNVDIIVDLIKNNYIGGVILYKKNYSCFDEMISVIKRLKDANKNNKIPLFIAIDQEGGRVNRMPSEINNIKNIYDLSKNNDSLVVNSARITGNMLGNIGINMNFAPVMDIYDNDKSKVLYKRCFYGDVDDVCRLGMKYVNEISSKGVIPVLKHFPGHGATTMDSHLFVPYVYDYKKITDKHVLPFERLIMDKDNCVGVDAIMVNHMIIRKLTDGDPASISKKFINEYIRDKYNYDGLVITDEMNMLARNIIYKFSYVRKMFSSGSDIMLVKIKSKKEAIKLINKYIGYVNENETYIKMLDDSVKRIINVKEKYNINDNIDKINLDIDDINLEIDSINNCINK